MEELPRSSSTAALRDNTWRTRGKSAKWPENQSLLPPISLPPLRKKLAFLALCFLGHFSDLRLAIRGELCYHSAGSARRAPARDHFAARGTPAPNQRRGIRAASPCRRLNARCQKRIHRKGNEICAGAARLVSVKTGSPPGRFVLIIEKILFDLCKLQSQALGRFLCFWAEVTEALCRGVRVNRPYPFVAYLHMPSRRALPDLARPGDS